MEKIIQTLIDSWTKGVDTYSHNGSTWLIFTESKQWVIELTESKTLWYNYNFFRQIFEFTSLDVVDNQQYITKWVEDNIINKVNNIRFRDARDNKHQFEDTLKNGVKHTVTANNHIFDRVEDAIQNGVKETNSTLRRTLIGVDDIIQNGIKETRLEMNITEGEVDDIIQDGVKWTQFNDYENKSEIEGVIDNGVKETNPVDVMKFFDNKMEDALQNGIKETKYCSPGINEFFLESVIENGVIETHEDVYHHKGRIDGVIKNGVKEVISYDEHKRGPVNAFGYIDDIIKEGEKINGTYAGGQRQSEKCKSVVEYGTKNPSV